jgi:hypothetical protein
MRVAVGAASPALKQLIFMKIKLNQISLGRHPFSDVPYWNLDIIIREQWSGCHHPSGVPYRNSDVVISERGPARRHLTDALHRRSDVVSIEQGSSHLNRQV